jgi:hypothetical protein
MSTYPDRVFDVHTHLFNAHALPVEAILERGSLNGKKLPAWLAKLVAGLVNALVGAEDSAVGLGMTGAPTP